MASRFLKLEKSEESFKLPSFLLQSKKEKPNSSNHEKDSSNSGDIKKLQNKIIYLLKNHPEGIQIERFNTEYQKKHYEDLIPSDYGFDDLVDLLTSFSLIQLVKKGSGEYNEMVYVKSLSENNVLCQDNDLIYPKKENINFEIKNKKKNKSKKGNLQKNIVISSEELPASTKLTSKDLNVFNSILSSHNGAIEIDFISSEYKHYTGKELDPSCWGFNSILDMLSNLSDIFTICALANGVFILCLPSKKEVITKNNEVIRNSNEDSLACPSLSDNNENAVKMSRKLPLEVQKRLKSLFNDFPNGLEISEIIGAYRGYYGATLDDFSPLEYGYMSLEALLKAHYDLFSVQHYDKNIMVFPVGYLKFVTSSIEFPLPACCAVSSNESYTTYDISKVFMKNTEVDFLIGEVTSPSKFHVIKKGENFSEALFALMDQMYEFYNRPISKRYEVKKESLLVSTPVVALYSDKSWYRAIIINKIDVAKLFLVDYGTAWSCSYTDLRLLHQHFLKLPAQAINASLYGIMPNKGTKYWNKSSSASKFFRSLVQNEYTHSLVHEVSEYIAISLWDDKNNNNIEEELVTKGFARYEGGHFPIGFGSSGEKLTTVYSPENNIGSNEIKISTDFEIAKEISNFTIEKLQEKKGSQLNLVSDHISYNIDTNKERNEEKVLKGLKKIDNENNTVVNSKNALKPYLQEQTKENLIHEFSTIPSITVQENINTISAEVKYHNDCADVEQLHYMNRNNSQSSVILEDSDQNSTENEFYKKRKVELLQISLDQTIRIIYLSDEPYMLSSEISRLMWSSDELHHQLKRKHIDVPYVVIAFATHADIFKQLLSYGVKDILDANNEFILTVTVYPLEAALKILNFFGYKGDATMAIKNLVWDKMIKNTLF